MDAVIQIVHSFCLGLREPSGYRLTSKPRTNLVLKDKRHLNHGVVSVVADQWQMPRCACLVR